MTAEEKALEIIQEYDALPLHIGTVGAMECQARAQLQCLIADALKDQDRDTRHACAEAISRMFPDTFPDKPGYWIKQDEAHAACMNADGFKERK